MFLKFARKLELLNAAEDAAHIERTEKSKQKSSTEGKTVPVDDGEKKKKKKREPRKDTDGEKALNDDNV